MKPDFLSMVKIGSDSNVGVGVATPKDSDLLGGKAPSYYATVDTLNANLVLKANQVDVDLKASKTYVDSQIQTANSQVQGFYETVSTLTTAYPSGNTNNYVITGVKEVDTLTITAIPTSANNITITLNGIAFTIALTLAMNTTDLVASAIRNATYTGWTTGGTGSIVTFTKQIPSVCSTPIFASGSTGSTATFSVTKSGTALDNNIYRWNGSTWVNTWVLWGSSGIADKYITPSKTDFINVATSPQLINSIECVDGKIPSIVNGVFCGYTDSSTFMSTGKIPIIAGKYKLNVIDSVVGTSGFKVYFLKGLNYLADITSTNTTYVTQANGVSEITIPAYWGSDTTATIDNIIIRFGKYSIKINNAVISTYATIISQLIMTKSENWDGNFHIYGITTKTLSSEIILPKSEISKADLNSELYSEIFNKTINDVLTKPIYGGGLTRIFKLIGCIGDSLSSGEHEYTKTDGTKGFIDMYEYSWGQCMARTINATVKNFSKGGLTADTFLNSYCTYTPVFTDAEKCQVYFIYLGTNDWVACNYVLSAMGNVSTDIDTSNYNNNANNFVGNYGKIISKILELQPKAKIFCITMPPIGAFDTSFKQSFSDMIKAICAKFPTHAYCVDLFNTNFFSSDFTSKYYLGGHFNAMGYELFAQYIMTYVDYIIRNNYSDFKQVAFIGTDYVNTF